MTGRTRLSFRTRLGLIITGVFIAAGAGLLFAQYLVVQALFASAIQVTTISCESPTAVPDAEIGCGVTSVEDNLISGGSTVAEAGGAIIQQTVFLSEEIAGGLLLWSTVLLLVFAALAAAVAFWLARRSLDRIGEVTAAARHISERDLGRRLDLPGPDDEIKELGDTIDGMLDRLELAFAAQDRFVANASHELRTPLTTTRAALEIPLRQGDVPPSLEPAVRRALRATDQSERLIAALLMLARGHRGLTGVEPVDLAHLATEQLDDLADAAREAHVTVERDLDRATTAGNVDLLERAVRNLVDNGIRHNTKPGGWMRVAVFTDGADRVIEVENTGEALPPESVALLTEPFFRGSASRMSSGDHPGMGLGLAIVESIARTHGGDLSLRAREGGGLVARLALPALDRTG